jgi:single-strand DNA-binding protein
MNNLRNSVRLIGFLGTAPEVKEFSKNKKVAKLNLATNFNYKNDKGERVEETNWHQLVVWNTQADLAVQLLNKGSEVAIEGRLVTRAFNDKEGNKKYITEIVVNEFVLLSKKLK